MNYPSKTTQTTIVQPWSGVESYLKSMYGTASSLGGKPMPFFPYQMFSQQAPLTTTGQDATLGYATNVLPQIFNAGTALTSSLANSADVANNPYVNQMLQGQAGLVSGQLMREWLPAIRSGASLAGQYGGSRQGVAEGVAIGEAAKALSNAAAQTQLGAYDQGLAAQKSALAFLPQQAQLGMLPAQLYGQVGGQEQAYGQQYIDDAMARYNYALQEPWNRLNLQNSIYSNVPWGQSATTKNSGGSASTGSSGAAGALGGALTGYSLGSAIAPIVAGLGPTGLAPTMLGLGLGPWGAILGGLAGLLM
ncbi:MAG: hypothetical protein MUE59_06150 [Thiobacillaceae bacterium]|nr:hypothetical protein [Thiobacillaceae bacterium]